jgi:YD repeat-containing protein
MGCDIHIFLETKHKNFNHWHSFTHEPLCPGRSYELFTALSNVRGQCDEPMATPGWPKDASWSANNWNLVRVSKTENPNEASAAEVTAAQWVLRGVTPRRGVSQVVYDEDGNPMGVTHPDWHSHGHCSVETLAKALRKSKTNCTHWKALLAAARAFEKDDYDVRFLLAYDN